MEFFENHMNSSIKTNSAYQKQFNIGARTLLDLLDSANEMFVAKSAYTNAKYDELYSQYRILASKGALNKHLGVNLPEEILTLAAAEEAEAAANAAKYAAEAAKSAEEAAAAMAAGKAKAAAEAAKAE
jgi:adhesin transport system outer membrane protein